MMRTALNPAWMEFPVDGTIPPKKETIVSNLMARIRDLPAGAPAADVFEATRDLAEAAAAERVDGCLVVLSPDADPDVADLFGALFPVLLQARLILPLRPRRIDTGEIGYEEDEDGLLMLAAVAEKDPAKRAKLWLERWNRHLAFDRAVAEARSRAIARAVSEEERVAAERLASSARGLDAVAGDIAADIPAWRELRAIDALAADSIRKLGEAMRFVERPWLINIGRQATPT
jgi:hypothetical protein